MSERFPRARAFISNLSERTQGLRTRASQTFAFAQRRPLAAAGGAVGAGLLLVSVGQGLDDSARQPHDGVLDSIVDTGGHVVDRVGDNLHTGAKVGALVVGAASRGLSDLADAVKKDLGGAFDEGWRRPGDELSTPEAGSPTPAADATTREDRPKGGSGVVRGSHGKQGGGKKRSQSSGAPVIVETKLKKGIDSFSEASAPPIDSLSTRAPVETPVRQAGVTVVTVDEENVTYSHRRVRVETSSRGGEERDAAPQTPEPGGL